MITFEGNEAPERVPVVFASDDRGSLMLGIALYSLLKAQRVGTYYVVYVLEDQMTEQHKAKILASIEGFACELHFIAIHELLSQRIIRHNSQRVPATTYARIFLPTLLPAEKRALYLDIDLLICRDLKELYTLNMGEALAGVVFEEQSESQVQWKQNLGILPEYKYFNAGVMLMDLERMREADIGTKAYDFYLAHQDRMQHCDQDVLNVVLQGQVYGLHPKWNWPDLHTRRQMHFKGACWGEMGYEASLSAAVYPAIIHFMGNPKPTEYNSCFHRALYRQVWLQSPWRDEPMRGKRDYAPLSRRIRHYLRFLKASVRMFFLRQQMNKDY